MTKPTEQPNQIIIKTIQSLISVVNHNLGKLEFTSKTSVPIAKALEEIDLFEKTTLFELQKAFE